MKCNFSLQVQRVFFLLSAGISMAILNLISRLIFHHFLPNCSTKNLRHNKELLRVYKNLVYIGVLKMVYQYEQVMSVNK